jgi:hypothetical protein
MTSSLSKCVERSNIGIEYAWVIFELDWKAYKGSDPPSKHNFEELTMQRSHLGGAHCFETIEGIAEEETQELHLVWRRSRIASIFAKLPRNWIRSVMVNTNVLKHLLKLCKLHNVLNRKAITSIQLMYKYMFLFLLDSVSLVRIALAVVVVFVGAWLQPI